MLNRREYQKQLYDHYRTTHLFVASTEAPGRMQNFQQDWRHDWGKYK